MAINEPPPCPYRDQIIRCGTGASTTGHLTLSPETQARLTACNGAGAYAITLNGHAGRGTGGDDGAAGVPARA